ncbi:hypothetical protein TcWFU_007685 [Taenia crassiceps]|uniref:Secreted protein n=1 Tax=Taenia crassiceps TaxID=6207 RepID=A0ABR4QBC7_9CEST
MLPSVVLWARLIHISQECQSNVLVEALTSDPVTDVLVPPAPSVQLHHYCCQARITSRQRIHSTCFCSIPPFLHPSILPSFHPSIVAALQRCSFTKRRLFVARANQSSTCPSHSPRTGGVVSQSPVCHPLALLYLLQWVELAKHRLALRLIEPYCQSPITAASKGNAKHK